MKYIFSVSFVLLWIATLGTWLTKDEKSSDKPVLYWVTDPNPVRDSQVAAFHDWLAHNAPPEDQFELRVDSANTNKSKKIIQSVSGVGGDIMDIATASGDMQYYRQMNIIQDLTEYAKERDFGPEKTYPCCDMPPLF